MTKITLIAAISLVSILSGCGTTWVKADNSDVSSVQLNEAKVKCQIDKKLYRLSFDETAKDAIVSQMPDKKSKQSWEETFKLKEKKVHSEIEMCMKNKGFIKEM